MVKGPDIQKQRCFAGEHADTDRRLVLAHRIFRAVGRRVESSETEMGSRRRRNRRCRLHQHPFRPSGVAVLFQHAGEHETRALVLRAQANGLFQVFDAALEFREEPVRHAEHAVRFRASRASRVANGRGELVDGTRHLPGAQRVGASKESRMGRRREERILRRRRSHQSRWPWRTPRA